jgi:hypothetical protein
MMRKKKIFEELNNRDKKTYNLININRNDSY